MTEQTVEIFNARKSYRLCEYDVACDGKLRQSGLFVDVTNGRDLDSAGDVLHSQRDRVPARPPRQLLTFQVRLTQHAATQRSR